jgi:hypothetical protein
VYFGILIIRLNKAAQPSSPLNLIIQSFIGPVQFAGPNSGSRIRCWKLAKKFGGSQNPIGGL